jgi:hypothetical protein
VAVVARFAMERLGVASVAVAAFVDAGLLADATADVLTNVSRSASSAARAFRWSDLVEEMRELWPIQYLLPQGALLTPDVAPAEPTRR